MFDSFMFDFITQKYQRIMSEENHISRQSWHVPSAKEMYNTTTQIAEFAENGTVLRSYNRKYGNLTDDIIAFESDGAHVNLMAAMVDRAFSWYYGPSALYTDDGYSYREVMEAIRRHDLPENITGDIPDDGNRDEAAKLSAEETYHQEFSAKSPNRELEFERKVHRLLEEMVGKTSPTGKLIYVADKVSAIVMTLFYDSIRRPPLRRTTDHNIVERDYQEMAICDFNIGNAYYASEMWTIDYFKMRHIISYDDTGYFTALLVMYTLRTKMRWYRWREADYSSDYQST